MTWLSILPDTQCRSGVHAAVFLLPANFLEQSMLELYEKQSRGRGWGPGADYYLPINEQPVTGKSSSQSEAVEFKIVNSSSSHRQ